MSEINYTNFMFKPGYTGVTITWTPGQYVPAEAFLNYFKQHQFQSPTQTARAIAPLQDAMQKYFDANPVNGQTSRVESAVFTPFTLQTVREWDSEEPNRFAQNTEYVEIDNWTITDRHNQPQANQTIEHTNRARSVTHLHNATSILQRNMELSRQMTNFNPPTNPTYNQATPTPHTAPTQNYRQSR